MSKNTVPTSAGLIRTTEAQRLFGLGRGKFWGWVSAGYFEVFRPEGEKSRIAYVRTADIERFITTGQPIVNHGA